MENTPLAVKRYIPNTSLSKRQATAIRRSQDLQAREPKPTSKLAAGTEMDWTHKLVEMIGKGTPSHKSPGHEKRMKDHMKRIQSHPEFEEPTEAQRKAGRAGAKVTSKKKSSSVK